MARFEEYFVFSYVIITISTVGDSGVGKTSLFNRYCKDSFEKSFIKTIGVDFMTKRSNIDGTNVKMIIWDTAGEERFREITRSYCRGADVAVLVFDKTSMLSFENIVLWLKIANEFIENKPKVLIGNKVDDLENIQVEFNFARQFANDLGMVYIETSALNSYQVELAFEIICREALKRKQKSSIVLGPTQKQQIEECC